MTSDAQRAANGCNAQKSTGPNTTGGKERSRLNALKHGAFLSHSDHISATILEESLPVLLRSPETAETSTSRWAGPGLVRAGWERGSACAAARLPAEEARSQKKPAWPILSSPTSGQPRYTRRSSADSVILGGSVRFLRESPVQPCPKCTKVRRRVFRSSPKATREDPVELTFCTLIIQVDVRDIATLSLLARPTRFAWRAADGPERAPNGAIPMPPIVRDAEVVS